MDKQTEEKIRKRISEVADENGHVSLENIIKLAKEIYGDNNPEMDVELPEFLAYAKKIDIGVTDSEAEAEISEDLPF